MSRVGKHCCRWKAVFIAASYRNYVHRAVGDSALCACGASRTYRCHRWRVHQRARECTCTRVYTCVRPCAKMTSSYVRTPASSASTSCEITCARAPCRRHAFAARSKANICRVIRRNHPMGEPENFRESRFPLFWKIQITRRSPR